MRLRKSLQAHSQQFVSEAEEQVGFCYHACVTSLGDAPLSKLLVSGPDRQHGDLG
jgi:hypothetical protein